MLSSVCIQGNILFKYSFNIYILFKMYFNYQQHWNGCVDA